MNEDTSTEVRGSPVPAQARGRVPAPPAQGGQPGQHALPAEELLKVLWDGVEVALALFDSAGQRLMINAAAAKVLGSSPSPTRIEGRVVYVPDGMTIVPEDQWPLRRALRGEVVRAQELLIRDQEHPDGRRMIVSALPIPLQDGSTGALVSLSDVTDQWRTDRASSDSLDQLSMLLEGAAGYVIMQLGPDGEIRSWSKNAEELLGYERSEVIGRPYAIFFRAGDVAAGLPASILGQARAGGTTRTDGARVRKDGTTFWADGVLTAVRDRDGRVVAFVKVLHDVTPQYEAERAVESLNRELRELNEGFSYSVSHDLRGPVRAVHGFARLLRERHLRSLPQEGQLLLTRIEESAVQMGELIDALLRYSRMQRQPMRTQAIDMTALVRRCWLNVIGGYPGAAVDLTVGSLAPVTGDIQLLQQVWTNLLDNAVKFSRRSVAPQITVSSQQTGEEIVFEVADNGMGFDERYADKLFKVFQRIHRNDDHAGVGMGLAIVHRLVHRHGGRVWASSAAGSGATFGFALPATALVVTDGR